jgi:hypothetical protein
MIAIILMRSGGASLGLGQISYTAHGVLPLHHAVSRQKNDQPGWQFVHPGLFSVFIIDLCSQID